MTAEGGWELAQMTIARLCDRTKGTVTIHRMVEQAKRETQSFQRGDKQQIAEAIKENAQPRLSERLRRRNFTENIVRLAQGLN